MLQAFGVGPALFGDPGVYVTSVTSLIVYFLYNLMMVS